MKGQVINVSGFSLIISLEKKGSNIHSPHTTWINGEAASRIFVDAAREAFTGAGVSSSAGCTVERVGTAKTAGGHDNVTVILCQIEAEGGI